MGREPTTQVNLTEIAIYTITTFCVLYYWKALFPSNLFVFLICIHENLVEISNKYIWKI